MLSRPIARSISRPVSRPLVFSVGSNEEPDPLAFIYDHPQLIAGWDAAYRVATSGSDSNNRVVGWYPRNRRDIRLRSNPSLFLDNGSVLKRTSGGIVQGNDPSNVDGTVTPSDLGDDIWTIGAASAPATLTPGALQLDGLPAPITGIRTIVFVDYLTNWNTTGQLRISNNPMQIIYYGTQKNYAVNVLATLAQSLPNCVNADKPYLVVIQYNLTSCRIRVNRGFERTQSIPSLPALDNGNVFLDGSRSSLSNLIIFDGHLSAEDLTEVENLLAARHSIV